MRSSLTAEMPDFGNSRTMPTRFARSLQSWGTADFETVFKAEVGQLDIERLPLQQGLSLSSSVTDSPRQVRVLRITHDAEAIIVTAGIFYTGIIAGCSCADDPTPISEQNEYCEVQVTINKHSADACIVLQE